MSDGFILVNPSFCTGCGSCLNVCPKKCITIENNNLDNGVAIKNTNNCIECGLCEKACHFYTKQNVLQPKKCYAAWSFNNDVRINSASGGIAFELYSHFISKGYHVFGVSNSSLSFKQTSSIDDIAAFRNSKYVEPDMGELFKSVKELIQKDKNFLFIGVPCQVAAVKTFIAVQFKNKIVKSDMVFVDLVCHGLAPKKYFNSHLLRIEKKKKKHPDLFFFRDPRFGTSNYFFTIYENGKLFYKKNVKSDDLYQVGYHNGIIYRTNCYSCAYSCKERSSDITLSDFSGLGSIENFNYSKINVSCVLCNSDKGAKIIGELNNRICFIERPLEEAFKEERLLSPTPMTNNRKKFEKEYESTKDFDKSVSCSAKFYLFKNFLYNVFLIDKLKKIKRKLLG